MPRPTSTPTTLIFFPEWCDRYHSVRNCKDCLDVDLNTQTVLNFPDSGMCIRTYFVYPGTRRVMPGPVITRSATGKAYYPPSIGTRVPKYPAGTRVHGARVPGSKCPAGIRGFGHGHPGPNTWRLIGPTSRLDMTNWYSVLDISHHTSYAQEVQLIARRKTIKIYRLPGVRRGEREHKTRNTSRSSHHRHKIHTFLFCTRYARFYACIQL